MNALAPMTHSLRPHQLSLGNKLARGIWAIVWLLLYRPTPRILHPWRCLLLRLFGAKLGRAVHPYPSARIWAPWNLEMGDHACLSEGVDCYSVARIRIGAHSTVSQYSFLCAASHDYSKANMPLMIAPIVIGERVWITADVFVGPGVSIGDGAVVLARSSVFTDLPPWTVARGNPAMPFKERALDMDFASIAQDPVEA
jgi:putative colanic acid biosynthesis acetyltransferase WcaF